jgi:uncharacterized RDD family membrane protein YckC
MSDDIRIDTPESVDLAFEPAGLGSRFMAAVIDGLIQTVGVTLILIVLVTSGFLTATTRFNWAFLTGVEISILLLLLAFLFFGYKVLLETFWNGQTVGKRAAGIRVVRSSGMPAGFLQVFVRNLLRPVDYVPSLYLLGMVAIMVTSMNQRLGDLAAGTVVVRDRQAIVPFIPTALSQPAQMDLTKLREHVMRLQEADLDAARRYWQRRSQLDPAVRFRVAARIVEALIAKMEWTDPTPPFLDHFIEEVLYVRAR